MVAIGGGAGLAGGFNTPLLGVVFMLEELTAEYSIVTIWPALLVCVAAAGFSNLGGEPIFGLGLINVYAPEKEQLMLAIPIGIAAGLVGGFFNRGLVWTTARLAPMVRQRPLRTGLCLGTALSVLALLSWGTSTADGEALVKQLLDQGLPELGSDHSAFRSEIVSIWITIVRVIAPILALAPGVPGGLIDPSLTFGAVLGYMICAVIGFSTQVGVGLGLAAGLAGATQLPLVSLIFFLATRWRSTIICRSLSHGRDCRLHRPVGLTNTGVSRTRKASESSTPVEEDKDHCWASKRDESKSPKISNQVDVKSHGRKAVDQRDAFQRVRGVPPHCPYREV
jgi:H+/Cl- antiporter ClcA